MKIFEILNESPDTDKQQRQTAENAYRQLLSAVKSGQADRHIKVVHPGQAAVLSATDVGIDVPITFAFIHRDKAPVKSAVGGLSADKKYLIFYIPDLDNIAKAVQSKTLRITFVHEFVHLLDMGRGGNIPNSSDKDETEYYNDPLEYNAYYQEAIHDFEVTLGQYKQHHNEVYKKIVTRISSFSGFLGFVNQFFESGFTENKHVKTDKRLKRRLFKYWSEIKDTLS